MQIANPIYDAVFKYLLEDNDIAKLMISTIIGEEIVALDFLPQESTIRLPNRSLTVYRLDFSATIRQADGTAKQVIIEIQKAKFAADIMRFRQYLGAQYQKKDNTYIVTIDGVEITRARAIVSIYFLGYRLDHTTAPVIKVARTYTDVTTGAEIREREEFIESLTHDSYVIQIPHLRPVHKTDIEELLSIFDQTHASTDKHVLQINEADYPAKYREVIRRLQSAIAEPEVQQIMDAEDEIVAELQQLERIVAKKEHALTQALTAQAQAEAKQAQAEAKQAQAKKEKAQAFALIEELRRQLTSKEQEG